MPNKQNQNIAITCRHSRINRTRHSAIGSLMLTYGGGGHRGGGTCQVAHVEADQVIHAVVTQLNAEG